MAQPASILSQMIAEAKEIRENMVYRLSGRNLVESVSELTTRLLFPYDIIKPPYQLHRMTMNPTVEP